MNKNVTTHSIFKINSNTREFFEREVTTLTSGVSAGHIMPHNVL